MRMRTTHHVMRHRVQVAFPRVFSTSPLELAGDVSAPRIAPKHVTSMASVPSTPVPRHARDLRVPNTAQSRRSLATDVSRVTSPSTQPPTYQPPVFSLNVPAQRSLASLQRDPSIRKLSDHLEEAQRTLTEVVADVNDRLTSAKKRKRQPADDAHRGGDAASELAEIERNVTRMTKRMDEALRKMIDGQHEVEQLKASLTAASDNAREHASTQASTQGPGLRSQRRRRRPGASGSRENTDDEDEEYPEFTPTDPAGGTQAVPAPLDVFRKALEDAKTRYQSMTLTARYAENNDFQNFKRVVHDALNPDGDVAAPDARTWFPDEAPPAPGVTTRAGVSAEDDDDDDIAIARATISIKCPLTLQEFKDPLSSTKCNHSFEAQAIQQLIRQSANRVGNEKAVQCPCGGCQQTLRRSDLQRDPVLKRKIERIKRARELEEEDAEADARRVEVVVDDEDGEEGEDVDDLVERQTQTQRRVKDEPRPAAASSRPPPGTAPIGSGLSSDEEEGEE